MQAGGHMGRRKDRGLTIEDVARIMGSQSAKTGGQVQRGSFPARMQSVQAKQEGNKEGK